MGKIASLIGGVVAVTLGVVLCFVFGSAFVLGLQFTLILVLLFGGLIAAIAGFSEIKDSMAAKKEECTTECKEETKAEEK